MYLLVFTFQILQIIAPCILSRFYCYFQWETQGWGVLTHPTQSWNWDSLFVKWNLCMGNLKFKQNVLKLTLAFFWSRLTLRKRLIVWECLGEGMWAATPETLWVPVTLEQRPKNHDALRAFQKGSGWCSQTLSYGRIHVLSRHYFMPPPPLTTGTNSLLFLERNKQFFFQSLFPTH